MLVGDHVSWVKLKGRPGAAMADKTGFGTLHRLEEGLNMIITGDYGVYTTPVSSIAADGERVIVITHNSTYLLKKLS